MVDCGCRPVVAIEFAAALVGGRHWWRSTAAKGFFAWAGGARQHFRLVIFAGAHPVAVETMRHWLTDAWSAAGGAVGSVEPSDFAFAAIEPLDAWIVVSARQVRLMHDWTAFLPGDALWSLRPCRAPGAVNGVCHGK